jgi:hypothetical protein
MNQITHRDCAQFLEEREEQVDVTTCLSVLHHFALGRNAVSAEKFFRLVDQVTRKVLFVDSGQNHEKWFRKSLPDWDADFIEKWIRNNSSFRKIYRLGTDEDNVPPVADNYRRVLFACTKE